jgi:phytoene dehydrogenase-like protein
MLKSKVANEMIEIAEKIIPELSNWIMLKEIATPIMNARRTLNTKGAAGGWTWNPKKSYAIKGLRKWGGNYRTPVRNLYAASQWSVHGGCVPRCAMAGKKVADIIISDIHT